MRTPILFLNVLIIAACGLIYELLAGTVASYLLGDSVTQFSLIIGLYLSALGIGAWLSKFIETDLAEKFVDIELAVAIAGGLSAPALFLLFSRVNAFTIFLYGIVLLIGILVGLELPLLMRLLREHLDFKELVSRVLSFDYIGSLFAAILFPLLFVPRLGLIRTSLVFGLLNAVVGLYGTFLLRPLIRGSVRPLRFRAALVMVILAVSLVFSNRLTALSEDELYADPVVYSDSSPYQRIVVTKNANGFQLFLNGNLQFSSSDEYRYHEALVHPALSQRTPERVVILGGGDGLALREVLRYQTVKQVTLVDLDPSMTALPENFPPLAALNRQALQDARVTVVNADAMIWLEQSAPSLFDAAIIDFPDPHSFGVGKLYTTRFYRLLQRHLTTDAVVAVQSTSPLNARRSYWCIVRTLEAAGFQVRPYHTTVPAFGVWGFALASRGSLDEEPRLPAGLRFLNRETMEAMFTFPADAQPIVVEVNRLDNQALVRYYEAEARHWN